MQGIVVEALLVQAPDDCVRLILEPYCLELRLADVLSLEELPPPPGLIEGSAIPARVTLRPGAGLLRIGGAEAYREVLWTRRVPFALATRRAVLFDEQPEMRQRERAFFAARGLSEKLP